MKVIGFAGYSGAGKTTLVERLIPVFKRCGQRVSVVKHAHHKFDVDHPGKDSWRHREAGAFEVVVASDKRLALMREFEQPTQLDVHQLIGELDAGVDWVFVEGFKHSDLPKIEVWRAAAAGESSRDLRAVQDGYVAAIATDAVGCTAAATDTPVFDIDDIETIAQWLLDSGNRFDYNRSLRG